MRDPVRRLVLSSVLALLVLGGCAAADPVDTAALEGVEITVWKSPDCSCCAGWIDYVEREGAVVAVEEVSDLEAIKREFGVPEELWSCHTALVGDVVLEGHLPASAVADAAGGVAGGVVGIALPGMPPGSPGMPGGATDPVFEVLTFAADGAVGSFGVFRP